MLVTGAALVAHGSGPGQAAIEPTPAAASAARGYVLAPTEGEALSGANGGIVIKVDPLTGSARMAMGTQHVLKGKGIQVHRHDHEDEILFVHRGGATGIVGEDRRALEEGSTVYIPQGTWHGVENHDGDVDIVWVVSPPGLESFFRDTRTPAGHPSRTLSPKQLEEIRRKHGMRVKPD